MLTNIYRSSGIFCNAMRGLLLSQGSARAKFPARLALFLFWSGLSAAPLRPDHPLAGALEAIEQEHGSLCPAGSTEINLQTRLDRLAEDLRGTIDPSAGAGA